MLSIEKYPIQQNFISGLPKKPFRNGVGNYEGVIMHATANFNDSANGERSYETNHFNNAFVHTFSDETQILQVADFNYLSWNAGPTGNARYLGNELCQSHDHAKFLLAYDKWVWLAAYQLYARKLGVTEKNTLWSHKQITDTFHESDHQDPDNYLAEHNMTWHDVVSDVTNYYNAFAEEDKMIQELQAQVQQLQQDIQKLKDEQAMPHIPDWAKEAVQSAVAKNALANPDGRSSDLYAILTILHRLKVV